MALTLPEKGFGETLNKLLRGRSASLRGARKLA
jgi:hypothetical protein